MKGRTDGLKNQLRCAKTSLQEQENADLLVKIVSLVTIYLIFSIFWHPCTLDRPRIDQAPLYAGDRRQEGRRTR